MTQLGFFDLDEPRNARQHHELLLTLTQRYYGQYRPPTRGVGSPYYVAYWEGFQFAKDNPWRPRLYDNDEQMQAFKEGYDIGVKFRPLPFMESKGSTRTRDGHRARDGFTRSIAR